MNNAEKISKQSSNNWLLPYEYICWKNLLADIEYDNKSFNEILKSQLSEQEATQEDLNYILDDTATEKWFLNAGYSDEFEALCEATPENFDKLVEENVNKVFYQEEKLIWTNRLLNVAFLKLAANDITGAQKFYNLYNNETLKQEFFKNILKRSIYEFYVNLKFNTELNNGKYTLNELNRIISHIEDLWVCTK